MNPTPPRRSRFSLMPLALLAGALIASMGMATLVEQQAGGPFAPPSPRDQARALDTGVARAVALARDNNTVGADKTLEGTVAGLGGAPGDYAVAGRLATRRGRPELAARFLSNATANAALSWDPNLWDALADAQKQTGDTRGAAESLRVADSRANLVLAEEGKTKPGMAPEQAEQVARFLSVGSYFQTAKKDNVNALRAYREAVRIAPNYPLTLNNLGYLLADTGTTKAQWQEALRLTRRAVELAPGDPTIADSYAWAMYRLGDYAGARRVLRQAVDDLPTSQELRRHLAAVYDALNLPDQAQIERTRAAHLDPGR